MLIAHQSISSLIYTIRGKQVMLDSDLALLYQVETKRLNEAVKRNQARFPEAFMFQLSDKEFTDLRSKFATSNYGGRRYNPYVFTEQGIAMLSAMLKSNIAVEVSIQIMNTFVEMRHFIAENRLIFERLMELELKQSLFQQESNQKFEQLFSSLNQDKNISQKVFFNDQIYDAFQLITDIIQQAKYHIDLIDNYVDIKTLNILSKKQENVSVTIYSAQKGKLNEQDIATFNAQYPTLDYQYNNDFHDRFLILDKNNAFHIGASLKDLGKKSFAITKIEDPKITLALIDRIRKQENL